MTPGATSKLPILLLHGLGGTGDTLAPLARALEAAGFLVAHPTLAECNRLRAASDGSPLDVSLDDLLDEAKMHARELAEQNGKPVVCGHSNGALLAPVLAADGHALHAVLLAPVPPPSVSVGVPVWLQRLFFTLSFGPGWSRGVLRFDEKRRLDPDPPTMEIAETLLPDSGRVLNDAIDLTCGGRFDPGPLARTPTTVLAGDRDRLVSLTTARRVAARYNADFHTVCDAGHWFPAERRFADTIAELIRNAVFHGAGDLLRRGGVCL